MKIIKGFTIFSLLSTFIIFDSCINEPEFPVTPEIGIDDYYFMVTPKDEDADTLFLIINFKDGDGDLGLPSNDLNYISTPFNNINFFAENGSALQPLGTTTAYLDSKELKLLSPIIDIPNNTSGKLVTVDTRSKPAYDTLPEFVYPYSLTSYYYDTIYVREEDKGIFTNATTSITPVDTLKGDGVTYYALLEKFYYEKNPNYNNIDVIFEVKQGNGTYIPFDWTATDALFSPFDERFPILGDSGPLEGTLKYAMIYSRFFDVFNSSTTVLRLKIQIRDRALHNSNVVYTGDFTLDAIRRN